MQTPIVKERKTMRIAVYGAAGDVGSRVVAEALSRGHKVTAVVRDPAQFDKLPAAAGARSAISMEEFAVVVLDEVEQAKHQRVRITAAY